MRRDMDLIRRIVLNVADTNGLLTATHWEDENNSHEKVGYHVRLLEESGYLKASILSAGDDPYYSVLVSELTMEGQDLADSLRSPKVWDKVKKRLAEIGVDATIDILKTLAVTITAAQLGIGA